MQHFLIIGFAILLAAATALAATAAQARDFRTAEVAMTAAEKPLPGTSDAAPTGAKFDLTQPLPVLFLGGMLTLEAGAVHERSAFGEMSRSGLGLHYLHHAAEGVPQFRLETKRLGSAGRTKALPLAESRIYIDANDADQNWLPKIPGFRTQIALGLRDLRRGEKSLALHPTATFRFERKRRLLLQIDAPTRLLVAYTGGANRQWTAFTQARKSRQYFVTEGLDEPWTSAEESAVSIGLRHRIFATWYASLQAGRLERHGGLDYTGPWAEVAMQSWTSLP